MEITVKGRASYRANRELRTALLSSCGGNVKSLWILLLAGTIMLSACSSSSSGAPGGSQNTASLSGNWQFTVASPSDQSFIGGLQGGFLLQTSGSVTGGAVYSISLPPAEGGGNPTLCNGGSAPVVAVLQRCSP